jgi:hypothetical protein
LFFLISLLSIQNYELDSIKDIQIIESKSNTEIVELEPTSAGVDQQRMTWGQFDVWLQDQLQIELGPFLLNRQIGVEGSVAL